MQSYPTIKYQVSKTLVEFADSVSNFVGGIQQFDYSSDIFSSSNLEMVIGKLARDIRLKRFWHIDKTQNRTKPPRLMDMKTCSQERQLCMSGY